MNSKFTSLQFLFSSLILTVAILFGLSWQSNVYALSNDATLSSLVTSVGTLSPTFSSTQTTYFVDVSNMTLSLTVTPTVNESNATIEVNGVSVNSGEASSAINLEHGQNVIDVEVTAQDTTTVETYSIYVYRDTLEGSQYKYLKTVTLGNAGATIEGKGASTDADGNVYIWGAYSDAQVDLDPTAGENITSNTDGQFLIKFDNNGDYLWSTYWPYTQYYPYSYAFSIADIQAGNGGVYLTGSFTDTPGDIDFDPTSGVDIAAGTHDAFLLKLDSDGNYLFSKTWGAGSEDLARNMDMDSNGNLYITGIFIGSVDLNPDAGTDTFLNPNSASVRSTFITKYNASDEYQWSHVFYSDEYGMGNGVQPGKIAVTNDYVYTLGVVYKSADFDPNGGGDAIVSTDVGNLFLNMLNSDGSYGWTLDTNLLVSPFLTYSSPLGLDTDSAGNVILTARYYDTADLDLSANVQNYTATGSYSEAFIEKITPAGVVSWIKNNPSSWHASIDTLAINKDDSVFTANSLGSDTDFDPDTDLGFESPQSWWDGYVTQYTDEGDYIWTYTQQALPSSTGVDIDAGLVFDSNGNMVVDGYFDNTVDFNPFLSEDNITAVGDYDFFVSFYEYLNSNDASLESLALSSGAISFNSNTHTYNVTVPSTLSDITFTPTSYSQYISNIEINGTRVANGLESQSFDLVEGNNSFEIVITADDGSTTETYTVNVNKESYKVSITDLKSTLKAYDSATDLDATVASESFVGVDRIIELYKVINLKNVITAKVNTDLTANRDWSGVDVQIDSYYKKILITNLDNAPGTDNTFSLFVKKYSGDNKVWICPNAENLTKVTFLCTGGYALSESSTRVAISTVDNQEYWVINGVGDGGAISYTTIPSEVPVVPTPEEPIEPEQPVDPEQPVQPEVPEQPEEPVIPIVEEDDIEIVTPGGTEIIGEDPIEVTEGDSVTITIPVDSISHDNPDVSIRGVSIRVGEISSEAVMDNRLKAYVATFEIGEVSSTQTVKGNIEVDYSDGTRLIMDTSFIIHPLSQESPSIFANPILWIGLISLLLIVIGYSLYKNGKGESSYS